jgi:hypothetical protein
MSDHGPWTTDNGLMSAVDASLSREARQLVAINVINSPKSVVRGPWSVVCAAA